MLERIHPLVARVQDQCRRGDLRQHVEGVCLAALAPGRVGRARRDRTLLQVVDPAHLLLGRSGNHHGGEDASEQRVLAVPARPDHRLEGRFELPVVVGDVVAHPRVGAGTHQVRHPLGVPHRVVKRDRPALRHGHQGEPAEPEVVDHLRQVIDASLEAEVRHVPLGQTVAALVEPHDRVVAPELNEVVPPHR